MFYSHEILTSREGGIATVWLVATLGSKTNNKRVNRKAILEVDVRRTCDIIIEPEAPMALRLQGNLLYGIVRVHSRQHDYILSDAETIQTNMRALLKAVRRSELDPNARQARPEQLTIQDDPAFLPDLALPGLDIDLSALNISASGSSLHSSILSAHSQSSSRSSIHERDASVLGLVIPSSASGESGQVGGFQLPSGFSSSGRGSVGMAHIPYDDEDFDIDPGFSFDNDGLMIEEPLSTESMNPEGVAVTGGEFTAGVPVRQNLQSGQQGRLMESEMMDLGDDIPHFNEDQLLPDAEAFPAMTQGVSATAGNLRMSPSPSRESGSSSSASAPLRRRKRVRRPKQLPIDPRQDLRNADLAHWKENYVDNMAHALIPYANRKANANAKRNAEYWVVGRGIGDVGAGMGDEKIKGPLKVFSGLTFLNTLRGTPANIGRKRRRADESDADIASEGRNLRGRDDDGQQLGRGDDGFLLGYDDGPMLADDDIEVGRHDEAPLEDPSMPWNISASSRQGSLALGQGFPSSIGGFSSGAGGPPGSLGGARPSSLDRRASRMTSASPLHGRGALRHSSLEISTHDNRKELPDRGDISSDLKAMNDFELYGPGAGVATQTAAESQWIRTTLTREANNFLDFVKSEIETHEQPIQDYEDDQSTIIRTSVLFEELLPPSQHSKTVGAQGFYHVLALATTGQLNVSQVNVGHLDGFGPIHLEIPTLL